jgi:hypothetical protein
MVHGKRDIEKIEKRDIEMRDIEKRDIEKRISPGWQ